MTALGNRQIMSANLLRLMKTQGKSRREVADGTGIKYSTLCDWINCNKYPRIDNIERLAIYFGVEKSALIEKPAVPEGNGLDDSLVKRLTQLTPEERAQVDAFVQGLLASRPKEPSPRK